MTSEQVELAKEMKAKKVPGFIIGIRLGCSESAVSRAVRGLGNYGKLAKKEPPSESVSRLVPSGEGAGSDGDALSKTGGEG